MVSTVRCPWALALLALAACSSRSSSAPSGVTVTFEVDIPGNCSGSYTVSAVQQ